MLHVSINNIIDNIKTIKAVTAKELIIVTKSNCYGLNSKYLIPIYKKIGIKYFFVNHYREYIKNINEYHNSFVLIMDSISLKSYDNIIYTINNIEDALILSKTGKKIKVHLQIDLSMNRLGIRSIEECKKIINILKTNKFIEIEGLYTHFSTSIDNLIDYNKQCDLFKEYINLYNFKIIHSAATSSLNKNIIGNFVRVGLGIYGFGNQDLPLKKAITAFEKIVKRINLKKGDTVGYESNLKNNILKHDSKVALINVGYFEFKLIDEYFKINQEYEKIGNSCMNHSHFIIDDEINNLTYLSFFKRNDIIYNRMNNFYHILISLSNYQKIYIMRYNNDISKTIKNSFRTSHKKTFRIFSSETINRRIIRFYFK